MLTQIASGFIGDVTDDFVIEKLSGAYSRYGNVIYFVDGQEDIILSVATSKDVNTNRKPIHYKSLVNNSETVSFDLFGERNYDEHVVKGNRIIIPGEYEQEYIEFTIDEVVDRREDNKIFEVFAIASYSILEKSDPFEPFTFTGTAESHLDRALYNTEYSVGLVESNRELTIEFENWTNPYEYVKRIAREFELELDFEIYHDGLMVKNRYVNLVDRVGVWRGREVTFGKDLKSIRRKESGDPYTALIGLGPEREDGTRLQVLVENDEALERWGRPAHNPQHLIGVYEPQSDREEMTLSELRQYTTTELNKRIALVDYEIDFLDLEHILGHEDKKIRFGDTIRIKDTLYTPNLFLEARIFEMKRNIIVPDEKEYVLGDFVEYDADSIYDIYSFVKREMSKKAGIEYLKNYAEPKKVESDTAPEIKDGENPIWVDTSKKPYVSYVANSGNWEKLSPTTPEEIDAYTKQQVDEKAAQALKDAQAFAENASNIKEGIIDVYAVPIRTSETGAGLWFDGVNGLYFVDSQGNHAGWWNLDGELYSKDVNLTGRIEALEGYFGKNQNVTIGDDGLTIKRPDGAVWMEDGQTYQDFSITGYDPYFMDEKQSPGGRALAFAVEPGAGSYYTGWADELDGTSEFAEDIRDKRYTVNFQRYQFIHSARYFIIRFQASSRSIGMERMRVSLYEGDTQEYTEDINESSFGGWSSLIVDLGTPSYERRSIDLRVGHIKGWKYGSRRPALVFRMSRVYLTDVLD